MKNAKFSEAQIMAILRQAENGVPVSELCREHGMSSASFYKWRAKLGGMDASMMSEMKAMAEENRRLKRESKEEHRRNPEALRVECQRDQQQQVVRKGCGHGGASPSARRVRRR